MLPSQLLCLMHYTMDSFDNEVWFNYMTKLPMYYLNAFCVFIGKTACIIDL